ncbi:hypothetical protein PV10_05402 [Exophiala mesophila]|uniref:Transcription factor domain-containing protein n=1 Tax=Exophiala mesophila TaxID=212818 RepID=A0A0D1Z9V2_EXOME|nr:uncharacterized protein PV10_05402 [Exophiala mesophila]KIV90794.1 hypothetical protein PV10_05402 [Exophiala mesophila]
MDTPKDSLRQLSTVQKRRGEDFFQRPLSEAVFHFVNASHPEEFKSKSTQKRIRGHVMTVEGRKRRKLPRFIALEINAPSKPSPASSLSHNNEPFDFGRGTTALSKLVPHSLTFHGAYPIEPNARARELIHFMHTEGDSLFRPFRYEWHAIALVDSSAFHLYLANAALFLFQVSNKSSIEYGDCVEAGQYFGTCLAQLARRIGNQSDSTSPGLITTILGLLCYNSCRGRWDMTQIHMDALERIMQLRGGFHGLESNVLFFTAWFDVLVSSFYDTLPRFAVSSQISDIALSRGTLAPDLQAILHSLQEFEQLQGIAKCLERVACLASYVNSNSERPRFWRNSVEAGKLIIPISHSLLSLPKCSDVSESPEKNPVELIEDMVRIALLAQLAALKRYCSLIADELPALQTRFTALLDMGRTQFPKLELWAVVSMALMMNGQRKLYVKTICQLMKRMSLRDAEEAVKDVKRVIWIERISSQNSQALEAEIDEEYAR